MSSKIAFLFPGQGSQAVGMGSPLAELFPEARACFQKAGDILGWDLLQACREGPEDRLRQTRVAQPALYVTGYATFVILKAQGIVSSQPDYAVAGHSIGEYAALAAAQVFSFEEGLRLVQERGRLMQEAGQKRPGGMAAILGLSAEQIQEISTAVQRHGICVGVNFNSPEQIVIAGEVAAMEAAKTVAIEKGAKRVIPLNVSGAFHSPLMKEAALAMAEKLNKTTFQTPYIPIAMNSDGRLHMDVASVQSTLIAQLDHPVYWTQSIHSLSEKGFNTFIECGAGRVLSGLAKKINRQFQTYSTESVEAIHALKGTLSPAGGEIR